MHVTTAASGVEGRRNRTSCPGGIQPLLPRREYDSVDLGNTGNRDWYIRHHGFVLLTRECLQTLAAMFNGRRVLDAGSGTGFLAHALAQAGVDVVAADKAAHANPYGFDARWRLDAPVDAAGLLPGDFDDVILSWPCYGSPFAMRVATAMRAGQRLVYQGEGYNGCTASTRFLRHVRSRAWRAEHTLSAALNGPHARFSGIHDYWHVYTKCEARPGAPKQKPGPRTGMSKKTGPETEKTGPKGKQA